MEKPIVDAKSLGAFLGNSGSGMTPDEMRGFGAGVSEPAPDLTSGGNPAGNFDKSSTLPSAQEVAFPGTERTPASPSGIPTIPAVGGLAARAAYEPPRTSTELADFGESPTSRGVGADLVPYAATSPNSTGNPIEVTDIQEVLPQPPSYDTAVDDALRVANSK